MNIAIDARLFGLEHAGIGRYLLNLIPGLIKANPETHFNLILPSKYIKDFAQPNVSATACDLPHYGLKEQIFLPGVLARHPADLYHFPHFNVPQAFNRPFVVTIHDLLWHETKDPQATTLSPLVHALKYRAYQAVVRHAVTRSAAIITPSHYVKNQILKFYPHTPPSKIHVIYEGVAKLDPGLHDPGSSDDPGSFDTPYLLYIGSLYPHKNLEFVIQALNGSMPLVIVSSRSVFSDRLRAQVKAWGLSGRVVFAGPLPDSQLASAIKGAQALIQPSLSEGFGLTGLEAMSLGTPVIAASAGAMPEVYGDAALWFDPSDPESFLAALKSLPTRRHELTRLGRLQAQKYSWERCARLTHQLYTKSLS